MYLNVSKKEDGRTYLAISKNFYDKETKKNRTIGIKSIGYVDELEKEFADPVAHFRGVARQMTEEEKAAHKVSFTIDMNETLPEDAHGMKNFGYALLLKIFHELELHKFLKSKARKTLFKFNTTPIMILLVISRILAPGSKKKAFDGKGRYFERFDFTDDDLYRSLTHFNDISNDCQMHMHEKIKEKYGSDTSIVYYDVTNYYFEISKPDELRRYGKAKQNRKKPVVQMGLAMDRDGVPLHYELFPGNKLDKETFRSVIGEVRRKYGTGRIIACADMGVITGDNIWYLIGGRPDKPKNGYVFSFSVRGGTGELKKYVLSDEDYVDGNGHTATKDSDFKIKSEVKARSINVTMDSGKTAHKTVCEKKVVFWSRKYAVKAKAERDEVIAKAVDLVSDPKKYNKATAYGAAGYVQNIAYDKETGEVMESEGKKLTLDMGKIEEQEKYDGYYAIVTSELHMAESEIVDAYRGLWEIEETFKITKSDLEARPVYVYDHAHINAHFLTCFIALTVIRLIQKKAGKQYSAARIVDALNKIECINEMGNIYLFGFRSEISDALGKAFGIDFTKKRMRLSEIKSVLGNLKKQ
jgi:transposase